MIVKFTARTHLSHLMAELNDHRDHCHASFQCKKSLFLIEDISVVFLKTSCDCTSQNNLQNCLGLQHVALWDTILPILFFKPYYRENFLSVAIF